MRRSISTPLRCVSDDEDEDGEKPSSPWVKAVGGTGDIGASSASGVCDLSEEEVKCCFPEERILKCVDIYITHIMHVIRNQG